MDALCYTTCAPCLLGHNLALWYKAVRRASMHLFSVIATHAIRYVGIGITEEDGEASLPLRRSFCAINRWT